MSSTKASPCLAVRNASYLIKAEPKSTVVLNGVVHIFLPNAIKYSLWCTTERSNAVKRFCSSVRYLPVSFKPLGLPLNLPNLPYASAALVTSDLPKISAASEPSIIVSLNELAIVDLAKPSIV